MAWQCRLTDDSFRPGGPGGKDIKVGDMWFNPHMLEPDIKDYYLAYHLSRQYVEQWLGKRDPIMVCLPNGEYFCVDSKYGRPENVTNEGWTVTGEAPAITVSPSINCIGRWHGFLTAGILSNDVEGRSFP